MTEESLPGGTPGTPSGPRPAPASHPEARARIKPPVPASAAWLPGMPAGRRNFAQIGGLALENDGLLPGVVMSYETFGERNAAGDNCVLVLHALTGDSHVAGGAGPGHPTPGWWDAMIGPG
ncbi:MAG: homoserine O-acetyltransferase, partial [Cellulomonadaceae bacterium]|nr:homoserine O-acetyltransferase [Cellulomonadaceae bacterium]